jgi:hypothetical protein
MNNMSQIRQHLRRADVSFVDLCPTCNEDFVDRAEFERNHGRKGNLCNNKKPQLRGPKVMLQWEALYRKIEASMLAATQTECEHYIVNGRRITD